MLRRSSSRAIDEHAHHWAGMLASPRSRTGDLQRRPASSDLKASVFRLAYDTYLYQGQRLLEQLHNDMQDCRGCRSKGGLRALPFRQALRSVASRCRATSVSFAPVP